MPNNKMNMTRREIVLCLLFAQLVFTQTATIQFYPIEAESFRSIQSLQVQLPDTMITTHATQSGRHTFAVPLGTYDIGLQAETRRRLNLSLVVQQAGEIKDLGQILFYRQVEEEMSLGVLNLTEEELDSESDESLSASTYLNTVSDVFYRTIAFHFSAAFFRPRGLDSSHRKVLINDIEMNKLNTGRPQWSNWGGLNDVMRNQIFAQGSQALPSHFGGLIGSTNINTSASQFGKGEPSDILSLESQLSASTASQSSLGCARQWLGLCYRIWLAARTFRDSRGHFLRCNVFLTVYRQSHFPPTPA